MSRAKPPKSEVRADERRLARDLAFSRFVLVGSVVLLVAVVIVDALYIAYVPRRNGHLMLPALVFVAPLVTVFLVILTLWNWHVMRRRLICSSTSSK